MNTLRATQQARGQAAVGNPQPMPSKATLYMAQLRPPALKVPPPKSQRRIAVQVEGQAQEPRVVKIIHTDSI